MLTSVWLCALSGMQLAYEATVLMADKGGFEDLVATSAKANSKAKAPKRKEQEDSEQGQGDKEDKDDKDTAPKGNAQTHKVPSKPSAEPTRRSTRRKLG